MHMKQILFMIAVLLFPILVVAQDRGVSIKDFEANEGQKQSLNQFYKPAAEALGNGLNQFRITFTSTKQSLNDYLHSHKLIWSKDTPCALQFYFSKDGRIDHVLYKFNSGDVETAQEDEFRKLLNEWIATYELPSQAALLIHSPFKYLYGSKFKSVPTSK